MVVPISYIYHLGCLAPVQFQTFSNQIGTLTFQICVHNGVFLLSCRYIEIFPSRKSDIHVQYGRRQNETSAFTPRAEKSPRTMQAGVYYSVSLQGGFKY